VIAIPSLKPTCLSVHAWNIVKLAVHARNRPLELDSNISVKSMNYSDKEYVCAGESSGEFSDELEIKVRI